ncbi:hypothetical protein E2C01_052259 [Portunus trituberculatus]|uniref:Uncharacterized protein n=1 Tax=Portunus trituberculatus TaxID=210409 RepID=A0A5B7GLD8_PORTR|nr:hypothetical protein [Portunus trituberculatus]
MIEPLGLGQATAPLLEQHYVAVHSTDHGHNSTTQDDRHPVAHLHSLFTPSAWMASRRDTALLQTLIRGI